jgi:hypothetical protein
LRPLSFARAKERGLGVRFPSSPVDRAMCAPYDARIVDGG